MSNGKHCIFYTKTVKLRLFLKVKYIQTLTSPFSKILNKFSQDMHELVCDRCTHYKKIKKIYIFKYKKCISIWLSIWIYPWTSIIMYIYIWLSLTNEIVRTIDNVYLWYSSPLITCITCTTQISATFVWTVLYILISFLVIFSGYSCTKWTTWQAFRTVYV